MKASPAYPSLYQINTRVWLTELSRALGKRATLDDIPEAELDRGAAMGFDWFWFLSVWQTGPAAHQVDRRVEIWLNAVNQFLSKKWAEKFFELYDDGVLHPVKVIKR